MHTRTTLRNLALASAVAAMLAASTSSAFAQTPNPAPMAAPMTPDTPPMATDATATAPVDSVMALPATPALPPVTIPAGYPTDYSLLTNGIYTSVDLGQAKGRGLSDTQIATIVKICKKTGLSFDTVSGYVESGITFPQIATANNLKLADVYDVEKEKQEIADYTTLHETVSSYGKEDAMMAMPMTSTMMPETPAMTPPMTPTATSSATLDIVDTAMAAKNLTTLVKALQVAGLVETLKGAGPFTVFAPDDKAFAALPAGALDALLADPAKLKTVLTYHVLPAAVSAADAKAMTTPTSPPTVEGATLQVTKGRKGRLKVNDATVIKADIQASNGVIHIIDKVLMPPADASMPTDMTPPVAPTPDAAPPVAPAPDAAAPPVVPSPAPNDTTPPVTPTPATP